MIPSSELIQNPDGSIYHIALKDEHVADWVITVGDPNRVQQVSKYFDEIFFKIQHREFITHTGRLGRQIITVISTGIGTDNIDIVLNELDAAVNIDPSSRTIKESLRRLRIIRIGTTGALQNELPLDSVVASHFAIGFDNVLNYYSTRQNPLREEALEELLIQQVTWPSHLGHPQAWSCDKDLLSYFSSVHQGITLTAPGFYAPQGRKIRLGHAFPNLFSKIGSINYKNLKVTNFEMETSAIYGLSALLGHHALSLSAVVAQRKTQTFSKDPSAAIENLIRYSLEIIEKIPAW